MPLELYSVIDLENKNVYIAKDMTLDNAILLVKALFDNYCCEDNISYGIVKQLSNKETNNEDTNDEDTKLWSPWLPTN